MAHFRDLRLLLSRPRTRGRTCRRLLSQKQQQQQLLLSPVSKLPVELLVEIFLYVVAAPPSAEGDAGEPTTLSAPHTPSYRSCASPFSTSHVCRSWRAISLALPRLWSSLRVVCPRTPRVVPLLSLWVHRARSCPLDLSLSQPHQHWHPHRETEFEMAFEVTRQVWLLFLAVMDRWSSVDVNVCMEFKSLLGSFSGETDGSTPLSLQAIKVAFGACRLSGLHHRKTERESGLLLGTTPIFSDQPSFFSHILRRSPHLRTLEWDNRRVPLAPLSLADAEWPASLTDVTLYASHDAVEILSGLSSTCATLRRLTIHEQTAFSPGVGLTTNGIMAGTGRRASPVLAFPVLETLRLGRFPHPEALFGHLVVPRLRRLVVLRGYNGRTGWRGLTRTSWFVLSEMVMRSRLNDLAIEIGGVVLDFMGESA